ncbi:major capsid protein [Peromfec virus RodF8_50]|uniref:Major capsid protein n=1 Tax=Peromfec virus RodF8_50 TaxID=2929380 RepID=A0A976N2D3_9VIRU|nr:major capsid protein [Peromfec virus RodF8_50]
MRLKMSRYTFDTVSSVTMRRSKLNQGHRVKTTMRVGDLVPVDVREVLPGDNWTCKEGHLVRLSSAYLRPIMDNVFMDVYEFFVPLRLLYDNIDGVFGNAAPNAYVNEDLDEFPSFDDEITVPEKTVGDYLGLPTGQKLPKGINALKFRGFALIYDEWFRNQNTVSPMLVQKGDVIDAEYPNNDVWSPNNYSGKLPKVGKKNDYFTSCLPAPQKGAEVTIGIGNSAPVTAKVDIPASTPWVKNSNQSNVSISDSFSPSWRVVNSSGSTVFPGVSRYDLSSWNPVSGMGGYTVGDASSSTSNSALYLALQAQIPAQSIPISGIADLSNVSAASVNDLRFAFQLQKMLEKDARGGSRMREYLLTHYGVHNSDARMQVPEFLGGRRTPLNLQQVAQTSQGTEDSPLASLGGYSQTLGRSGYRKAFTEHGYIYTIACIRYEHSYQQGIDKSWFRNSRNDFYDPLFANLGEQPVYLSQIYGYASANLDSDGDSDLKAHAFGYQEAWADYRYAPDIVTGEMRSTATNSFDVYHFADYYSSSPVLTQDFTNETASFFRRTTAVGDNADVDDFIVDFYFDCYAYRVMPVRSIPGLIDHH